MKVHPPSQTKQDNRGWPRNALEDKRKQTPFREDILNENDLCSERDISLRKILIRFKT